MSQTENHWVEVLQIEIELIISTMESAALAHRKVSGGGAWKALRKHFCTLIFRVAFESNADARWITSLLNIDQVRQSVAFSAWV